MDDLHEQFQEALVTGTAQSDQLAAVLRDDKELFDRYLEVITSITALVAEFKDRGFERQPILGAMGGLVVSTVALSTEEMFKR